MSISMNKMFTFSEWLYDREQRERGEKRGDGQRATFRKSSKILSEKKKKKNPLLWVTNDIKNNTLHADVQPDEKLVS